MMYQKKNSGFNVDYNKVSLIDKKGKIIQSQEIKKAISLLLL